MIQLKHKTLIRGIAIVTFVVGLANLLMFALDTRLYTGPVGALCVVLATAYLIILKKTPEQK